MPILSSLSVFSLESIFNEKSFNCILDWSYDNPIVEVCVQASHEDGIWNGLPCKGYERAVVCMRGKFY